MKGHMRYSHYYVRSPWSGVHRIKFEAHHYKHMGVPHSMGMPILEAHMLVNEWNKSNLKYTYWLEAYS